VVRGTFSPMTRAIARRLAVSALAVALASAGGGCSVDSNVSRALGARCDGVGECDDRCLAPGAVFPGGLCSSSCEASVDCPFGSSCADTEGGVCLFTCRDDLECAFLGTGWRCLEISLREDAARKAQVCLGG
jgi:hypothetical protein